MKNGILSPTKGKCFYVHYNNPVRAGRLGKARKLLSGDRPKSGQIGTSPLHSDLVETAHLKKDIWSKAAGKHLPQAINPPRSILTEWKAFLPSCPAQEEAGPDEGTTLSFLPQPQ